MIPRQTPSPNGLAQNDHVLKSSGKTFPFLDSGASCVEVATHATGRDFVWLAAGLGFAKAMLCLQQRACVVM